MVKKFEFNDASTNRKRKRKQILSTTRPRRNYKRPRISSSSEDDTDVDLRDSEESTEEDSSDCDEYKPFKKIVSSDESTSSKDLKMELENADESDFDPESDLSEEEKFAESSDLDTQSEDSEDSHQAFGKGKKRNKKAKISKVQEHLIKQHQGGNKASKNEVKNPLLRTEIIEHVRAMKAELLQKIEELGDRLPKNTLDELINKLGGCTNVAEMTGRKVSVFNQKYFALNIRNSFFFLIYITNRVE